MNRRLGSRSAEQAGGEGAANPDPDQGLGLIQDIADDSHDVGDHQRDEEGGADEIDGVGRAEFLGGQELGKAETEDPAQRDNSKHGGEISAEQPLPKLEFDIFLHEKAG